MTNSRRKLSDLASHLIIPDGIVKTRFPRIAKLAKIAGIAYDPWQQGLLTLMYGLRKDGKYACGAGGIAASLPRQVGKTFTFGTAAFLDCLLTPGLKVLWTAHRSRTSDETFASMQTLAHDATFARYVENIRRANGQQEIGFRNGSRILFGAREQGFGRGFDGIDQIVFDEAQILTERALDDMVPSTNTAANPLIVMIGTPPKPGDPSEVFQGKRQTALAGTDKDLLYVEFSAPRGSSLDDRDAWAAANPSYPQRTSETAIARMRAMLSDDSFRREALGIWDKTDIKHAIDPQQWEQAGVDERRDGGAVSFAIDMPPDRASIAIGACMRYKDKSAHVELARFESTGQNGLAWVIDWIAERWPRTCSVIIDAQSPATVLVQDLKQRGVRITLTNSTDMGQACGRFTDMLRDGTLHHLNGQEPLDIAVKGATKRNIGQSGAFGWNKRTADVDISPLVAITLALHGACTTHRNPLETRRVIRLP